jgi:serine/threonine protein kinase
MPIYEESLHDMIQAWRHKEADKIFVIRMIVQMLSALGYLHSRSPKIIHRDVKPMNILRLRNTFVLSDFGLAKREEDRSTGCLGTRSYLAPEIFQGVTHTPESDIYALGVTILECMVGLPKGLMPGDKRRHSKIRSQLEEHEVTLAKMVDLDPKTRPTAHQLLNKIMLRHNFEAEEALLNASNAI